MDVSQALTDIRQKLTGISQKLIYVRQKLVDGIASQLLSDRNQLVSDISQLLADISQLLLADCECHGCSKALHCDTVTMGCRGFTAATPLHVTIHSQEASQVACKAL